MQRLGCRLTANEWMLKSCPVGSYPFVGRWKAGDRIEYEIGMPLRLEAVDPQNANTVALVRGPLALFAIGDMPANLTRLQLLTATSASQASQDWVVRGGARSLTLRPFSAVRDESYRLYHKVGCVRISASERRSGNCVFGKCFARSFRLGSASSNLGRRVYR